MFRLRNASSRHRSWAAWGILSAALITTVGCGDRSRNGNGDGTFSNVTGSVGINTSGGVTDIAVGDLDANNAIDMIAARGDKTNACN